MSPQKKITDRGVAGLPIAEGRAELLEEIIMETTSKTHVRSGVLVPLAAAAAVVTVVGGAWALSTGQEPDTSPRGPGFGSEPTAPAGTPRAETPTESPTEPSTDSCVVMYDQGSPPPATDGPELAHCDEVILDEQQPGDVVEEERYQRPPRPVLLTADGWDVDGVYGMDLDWVGPGDGQVHQTWVQAGSADPFAYDRYDRAGERIEILGLVGRLTGFAEEGKDYQVLFTSPVRDGGPGLLLETSSLGPAEFRALVESLQWVDLAEYEAVVKPAVD